MNGRICGRLLSIALMVACLPGFGAFGQDVVPDATVDVSEGVYLYLRGMAEEDPEPLGDAIERFTAALDRQPDNHAALLFRALSRGALGLQSRDQTVSAADVIALLDKTLEIRSDPRKRAALKERDEIEQQLSDETLAAEQRVALDSRLRFLTGLLSRVDGWADFTDDRLRADLKARKDVLQVAAGTERDAYRLMSADLARLIAALESPEAIVRLLDVVARTKVARLNENEALRLLRKDVQASAASAKPETLRLEAVGILEQAAAGLEAAIAADPIGLDAVRAKFFLGVVRFRQGVPLRTRSESVEPDMGRLRQARVVMESIADDEGVARRWRGYAALYLGLILPFEAAEELDAEARGLVFDAAEERLKQASEFDTEVELDPESGEPDPTTAYSAGRAIPGIVWRQRDQLTTLRDGGPTASRRRNDVYLSLSAGAHRDTNVVLLGERTDLPRDVSRKADFGFTGGLALGYTLDLDDRWTIGMEGRVTQLWHADVDEFDEQNYGGSAALQYEALGKEGDFGPVFLRLQYDYGYTLLGRSAFLYNHALTPNVRIYWADYRAETEFYYRYELRDYSEPLYDRRFDRTGVYHALGVTQRFDTIDMAEVYASHGIEPWGHPGDASLAQDDPDYPKRYLTPYIGFEYAWDETDGQEFDRNACVLSLGLSVPLPLGLVFDGGGSFEWEDYRHRGSLVDFHRRPRRDFIQRYEVALSRTFVLRGGRLENRYRPEIDRVLMTIRAHASWTLDDSNVQDRLGEAIFSYDRTVYGLSVAFTLN